MSDRQMTQLPNGDLWSPPVRDEDGNNVPRPDTFQLGAMPQRSTMSPDVAAMLMADLQRQKDAK